MKSEKRGVVIDWEKVRARLARLADGPESGEGSTRAREQAILAERARRLAESPAERAVVDVLQLVTFALDGERYGIETRYVREIVPRGDVTPIPGTPGFLLGVINLRGELLPVVDLPGLFEVAAAMRPARSRVIVLGGEHVELGILADAVEEVRALPVEDLQEAPASIAGVGREYLRAVSREALIVLDGEAVLASPRGFVTKGQDASEPGR